MLDETTFLKLATTVLATLADRIEADDADAALDIELTDGVLTITLPDHSQYVINRHLPSRKIWTSSPVSGAHYFEYDGSEWSEGGLSLASWLIGELEGKGVHA